MTGERREEQVRTREEFGLRTDPAWVDWVAEHGTDGGTMMMLPIPLSDAEIDELRERDERARTTIGAFTEARLAGAAGAWLDHRAGGMVRLLLAHPDPAERAAADAIVAEHGGVVELVEHSTRELAEVRALIHDEMARGSEFGLAVTGVCGDVWANAERLMLRGDLHPPIPERIHAAVAAGTLIIEHPAEPAGWDPDEAADPTAPPADEPLPRWPGDDLGDPWGHWYRCVQYVAARCVGGPLVTAERLAREIGLTVRVLYPGSGRTDDLRGGRVTVHVNAAHVVRRVEAA